MTSWIRSANTESSNHSSADSLMENTNSSLVNAAGEHPKNWVALTFLLSNAQHPIAMC